MHVGILALWMQCVEVDADLTFKLKPSEIGGVKTFNKEYAYDAGAASATASGKPEWMVMMKSTKGDKEEKSLCDDAGILCTDMGDPDHGGIGYVSFEATEEELAAVVSKHKDDIEFIEPSMPMYLPPDEETTITDEDPLAPFGSTEEEEEMEDLEDLDPALVEILEKHEGKSGLGNYGHWIIVYTGSEAMGAGPYSFQKGDQVFSSVAGSYSVVCMTSQHSDQCQKCNPNGRCNGQPFNNIFFKDVVGSSVMGCSRK